LSKTIKLIEKYSMKTLQMISPSEYQSGLKISGESLSGGLISDMG
jgi:hypothetical protein